MIMRIIVRWGGRGYVAPVLLSLVRSRYCVLGIRTMGFVASQQHTKNSESSLIDLNDCVTITFVEEKTGDRIKVSAPKGKTVLDVALDNNVDIEGACGGELACSTCHVIVQKELYDKLPPKKEEEDDMLDLATGLTNTLVTSLHLIPPSSILMIFYSPFIKIAIMLPTKSIF